MNESSLSHAWVPPNHLSRDSKTNRPGSRRVDGPESFDVAPCGRTVSAIEGVLDLLRTGAHLPTG